MADEEVTTEVTEEVVDGAEEVKAAPETKDTSGQAPGDGEQTESKTLLSDDGGDGDGDKDPSEAGVPDKYEFKAPEDFDLSEEVQNRLDAFTDRAKDMSLSQEQYQALIDYDIERGNAAVEQLSTAYDERVNSWAEEVQNDKELGGEKLTENLGVAKKVLDGYGSEGFQKLLDKPTAENPDGLGLGNHPEMIRFLHRVGKSINDSEFIEGAGHKSEDRDSLQRMYPTMTQFN